MPVIFVFTGLGGKYINTHIGVRVKPKLIIFIPDANWTSITNTSCNEKKMMWGSEYRWVESLEQIGIVLSIKQSMFHINKFLENRWVTNGALVPVGYQIHLSIL